MAKKNSIKLLFLLICFAIDPCDGCLGNIKHKESNICYGDLGCFSTKAPFFNPLLRPVSLLPAAPSTINTTFMLYTRENPVNEQYLSQMDVGSIQKSHFESEKKTIFLIHGFISSAKGSGWMLDMKNDLLNVTDVNVILVDWSSGAGFLYAQAVANTRLVGREIGNFIRKLQVNFQINPSTIYLIGHSLGAHIVGYAGKWMNKTVIGRITGLDPAGPYFQYTSPEVRLDSNDAVFVDVIHTAGGKKPFTSLGLLQPLGNADFYPNGGYDSRACSPKNLLRFNVEGLFKAVTGIFSCNHGLAVSIYAQSIQSNCPFTSYACEDFQSYKDGKCFNCQKPGIDCDYVGYHSDYFAINGLNNSKFYLTTSKDMNSLCIYHWILEITIYSTLNLTGPVDFIVKIKYTEKSILNSVLNNSTKPRDSNVSYYFLIQFSTKVTVIDRLEFSWKYTSAELNDVAANMSKIFVTNITLIPIDIIPQRMEDTSTFCDKSLINGIYPNRKVKLLKNDNCSFIFN